MSRVPYTPCCALAPGETMLRHVHSHAYATLVLDGGYEEAGECGRWRVRSGDVLLHAPFSAHRNQAPRHGARLLNLPVPASVRLSACGRVEDPDLVVRLAERDPMEAAEALMQDWRPGERGLVDAPDLLAHALSGANAPGVQAWSRQYGVSRETAFRWFRSVYGVAPTRYRIEARARLAWRMIVDCVEGLADIATAAGYADQAHMTRDVTAFTGRPPGAWRAHDAAQRSFKTGVV